MEAGPAPGANKTALLAAGLSLLLHLGNMFVLGLAVLSPAPLVWLYRRRGMKAGRLGVMVAVGGMILVSMALFGNISTGLAYLYAALMALGLGEALSRGYGEDLAVFLGVVGSLLALTVLAVSLTLSSGQGVADTVEQGLNTIIRSNVDQLAAVQQAELDAERAGTPESQKDAAWKAGLQAKEKANAQALQELEKWLKRLVDLGLKLGVGIVIMGSVVLAWLNTLISRGGLPPGSPRPTLIYWRSPEQLAWVFIAGAAAFLLLEGWWKWAGANVALILATVYLLQGLAVIGYYFDKKRVPRLARAVVYGAIVILEFPLPVVAAVGFLDNWLNIRRLGKPDPA